MTGLEKIIEKINADSESLKSSVIASAEEAGKKIILDAENQGKTLAVEIKRKADADAENIIAMANSAANQSTRQTVLKAKVEAVNETLAKLLSQLGNLPDDKYFETVIKLAGESAIKGECTAYPSKKDLGRLPSDFEDRLNKALGAKDAKCVLSKDGADIESGVLLDYGNIAVNCSFEAVIEENSDYYKEKISEIIF